MTIRLLYSVGNDPQGAVLTVDERRAQRLIRTGYAEVVEDPLPVKSKRQKESAWPSKAS